MASGLFLPWRQSLIYFSGAGKFCQTRFRHYPLTLGLGFLGLHRRPMIDSIFLKFRCYTSRFKGLVTDIDMKRSASVSPMIHEIRKLCYPCVCTMIDNDNVACMQYACCIKLFMTCTLLFEFYILAQNYSITINFTSL